MRITTSMSANNAVYYINQGRQRMDNLNETIATQQRVNTPSDDPVSAKKILDLQAQSKTTDQYLSNIKNGVLWLDMAGTTLEGVFDTVSQLKSIANQAVNGLNDPLKKQDLMTSLRLYRDQLMDVPNSALIGDQNIFSGFNSTSKPFPVQTVTANTTAGSTSLTNIDTTGFTLGMPITGPGIPDNTIVTAITTPGPGGAVTLSSAATATATGASLSFKGVYKGTDDLLKIEVNSGMQIDINVTGGTLLRGGTPPASTGVDIIKTIDQLMLDISNGNQSGVISAASSLTAASTQLQNVISDVGMRKARLDNIQAFQERKGNVLQTLISNLQEVDLAKAATQLTQEKTSFEAALAATAKITPLSLLDFLR